MSFAVSEIDPVAADVRKQSLRTATNDSASSYRRLRTFRAGLLGAWLAVFSVRAQHLHIQTSFTATTGWDVFWYDFDAGAFAAGDYSPTLTSSMRLAIPAMAGLTNALGHAGDPVWVLPEVQTPAAPSIGFGTQGSGLSGGQVRLRLASFSGPGDFAMFGNGPFGDAQIHAATRNGLGQEDGLALNFPGDHTHLNLAFNRPGLYQLGWRAEGTLAATGQSTNSPVVIFSFQVAPPAAPRLRLETGPAPGSFILNVESETELPLRIDTSTDALQWTGLTNFWSTTSAATLLLTDTLDALFLRASHPIP